MDLTNKIIEEELLFDQTKLSQLIEHNKEEWKEACNQLSLTYDYLPNPHVYLYQHRDMFRFNTDTVLLASFMRIHKDERVLDIGTNNGVLMVAAAQFTELEIIGVELQKEACELAQHNLHLHGLEDRCQVVQEDVCNLIAASFDVIITNPPYFSLGKQSIQASPKQQARHELTLTLAVLIDQINRLLKDGGHCYMVHRADRLSEIIWRFHNIHMEVKRIQPVYDEQKQDARCVLIEAVKQAKPGCQLCDPITIKRT